MESKYNPLDIEKKWQDRWKNENYFKPKIDDSPAYSILMPPPNVTGILTLGHVLNSTVQDIFARKARQEGYDVLWLMGTDHAGIATQTVVEKAVYKQQKKRRDEIGKERLIKEIKEWIREKGNIILNQIQQLGLSLDLSDQCFTMDANYSLLVQETFVRLYHKGLIYKGKKMVSWCPISLTALSDEEVCYKKQHGRIFYFKMQLVEQPDVWLTIATTRPETIMGDVAIAVNPCDHRYKDWIGYHVRAVFPNQIIQQLPIIGDDMVDPNFGTGILKITPAHDLIDYEIGQKHHLPCVDILNPDGTLNQLAGELDGMDRFVARKHTVELLKQKNAYLKEELHENNIGFSERGDVPIEYRLSEQWFLKYPQVTKARSVVKEGKIKFFPQYFEKVYDHWMESIHDWCISRQIWWGHRIPAWKNNANEIRVQIDSPGEGWEQEIDVLDTWFSSWLWIYARLNLTGNEKLIKKFSPISLLVTGPDIIFFWVARMVMANLEYTDEIPFRQVYFTGIIRDKQGRKMSKSLGNSPDPIQLIEKYGADALRLGVIRSIVDGKDIQYDEKQIELGRNLITKLWNATRFRLLYLPLNPKIEQDKKEYPDLINWLFDRFDKMLDKVEKAYLDFRLQEVIHAIHNFFWYDYCDKFLESMKPLLISDNPEILSIRSLLLTAMDDIFSKILILFHPFIPHLTEELWEILEYSVNDEKLANKFLCNQHFPPARFFPANDTLEISAKELSLEIMDDIFDTVNRINDIRGVLKIPAQKNLPCWQIISNETLPDTSKDKLKNFNKKLKDYEKKYAFYNRMFYLKSDLHGAMDIYEKYNNEITKLITKLILEKLCKFSGQLEYCYLDEKIMEKLFFPTKCGIFCLEIENCDIETVISFFYKQISERKSKREQFQKRREKPEFSSKAPPHVIVETDEFIMQLDNEIFWLEEICYLNDKKIS